MPETTIDEAFDRGFKAGRLEERAALINSLFEAMKKHPRDPLSALREFVLEIQASTAVEMEAVLDALS